MSSLLERVIVAHRCRSTHHHIAIDALGRMTGEDADKWRDLLLLKHEDLLAGAKAPDAVFKDFQNHVLHVSEGEWGGARGKATEWYAEAVAELKAKRWGRAAYALGVLSHYYADPVQPFHTGQTEEEGAIHRALEWSVAKSRDTIMQRIAETGYPEVPAGDGIGFVSDMVRAGAERSHPHYQTLIDHYNLEAGVKNPPAGLDETLIEVFADLIAYATQGLAVLFSRAIAEAGIAAPKVHLSLPGYLATLDIPVRMITKNLADGADRRTVEKMYAEFEKTGKVIKTLPDDDKAIRKLHARQVLRVALKDLDAKPLEPLGTKHEPRDLSEDETVTAKAEKPKKLKAEKPKKEKPAKAEKTPRQKPEKQAEPVMVVAEPELEATEDEAVAAETLPTPVEARPVTIARPMEVTDEDEGDDAYVETEVWTEPDDMEASADDEDEIEVEGDDADEMTEEELEEEERLRLEAELEAELQAEIEAELALEEAEEIEDETLDEAEPVAATGDDSHWRVGQLNPDSPVVEAPSIGRKTAERLAEIGIFTVGDLLEADTEVAAELLDVPYITEDTLIDWQDQAELMMTVPGLRTHDAQVLVGAGIRSADELANASARDIFIAAIDFLSTPEGDRIVRDEEELEEDEIEAWIDMARNAAA